MDANDVLGSSFGNGTRITPLSAVRILRTVVVAAMVVVAKTRVMIREKLGPVEREVVAGIIIVRGMYGNVENTSHSQAVTVGNI
jgi:hypothetical protein